MADCVAGAECNDVSYKYDPKSVKVTGLTISGGPSQTNSTEDKLKKFAADNGLQKSWDDMTAILRDKCNPPSHNPPDYQTTSKGSCTGETEGTCSCVASKIPNPKNPKELIPFVTTSDITQDISAPGVSVGGKTVDLTGCPYQ
jgi:hypothetical protein